MIIDNGAALRIKGPKLYNIEGDNGIYVIDLGDYDALAYVMSYTEADGPEFQLYDLEGYPLGGNWPQYHDYSQVVDLIEEKLLPVLRDGWETECIG